MVKWFDRRGRPLPRSLLGVFRKTLLLADTTTIRVLLANASLLWAVALAYDTDAFRHGCCGLMNTFGDETTWALLFSAYFVLTYWRLIDRRARPRWAVAVNTFGLFLWLTSTLSINIAAGHFDPSTALEWVLCAASAWALYRTGLKTEVVTP
jgi:hypothetical protein